MAVSPISPVSGSRSVPNVVRQPERPMPSGVTSRQALEEYYQIRHQNYFKHVLDTTIRREAESLRRSESALIEKHIMLRAGANRKRKVASTDKEHGEMLVENYRRIPNPYKRTLATYELARARISSRISILV